mgnify:CR=1 FL=1
MDKSFAELYNEMLPDEEPLEEGMLGRLKARAEGIAGKNSERGRILFRKIGRGLVKDPAKKAALARVDPKETQKERKIESVAKDFVKDLYKLGLVPKANRKAVVAAIIASATPHT